jgi:hypothetical protein
MKINKKGMVALALAFAVLIGSVAYAVFNVTYNIPNNHVSIAGIGVTVKWLTEPDVAGALVTTMEFSPVGWIIPGDKAIGVNPTSVAKYAVLFVPDCNGVTETITWTTTLNSTIGTIALEREIWHRSGAYWTWEPLSPGFTLTGKDVFGLRPPPPPPEYDDLAKGYIRIVMTTLTGAPHGDFTFSITFNGVSV